MTIKAVFSTPSTVMSTELNSLANTSSVSNTTEQDNTSDGYVKGLLSIQFTGVSGSFSGVVTVFLMPGTVTGELSDTSAEANMRYVGYLVGNGTTQVSGTINLSDIPPFWKVRVKNESGAAFASSGSTIKFTGIKYQDVT